jgi:hypothetical protein
MSFDLFFCWHKKEPVNWDSVADWSQKHLHFQRNDSQLFYSNEDTGVYFSLDFEVKDAEEEIVRSDYVDSGLSFNLNFARPSFFAYEAMPIIVDLCRHFGLAIYDPQASDPECVNQNPAVEELTESWRSSNRNAVSALHELNAESPFRMPAAVSDYLWNYCRTKKDLQTRLGDDIFVPGLFPFGKSGRHDIGTMIVCTSDIPMIVPNSQWVVVRRPKKRLFGLKEDMKTGIVSARVFESALGDAIVPYQHWEPSVRVINPESAAVAAKRLESIQDMIPAKEFVRIAPDKFIDTEIEMSHGGDTDILQ